jgi:hypothetical protein
LAASGAGAGAAGAAGAGAGSSFFTSSAGFCSSAFLQPTTAKDNVAKKTAEITNAKTFFIECHLLSIIYTHFFLNPSNACESETYAFFLPCQDKKLSVYKFCSFSEYMSEVPL